MVSLDLYGEEKQWFHVAVERCRLDLRCFKVIDMDPTEFGGR